MLKGHEIALRAIERSDLPLLQAWRNEPQLRKNFREFCEISMEDQRNWFERVQNDSNCLMFLIESLDDRRALGVCGLVNLDWRLRCAELSLYIGEKQQYIDRVFAPDAVNVLLRYAYDDLNLHKVWAEVYEIDRLKGFLLKERFAFHQDGTLRDSCFADGRYWNSSIFSLLSHEWQSLSMEG